MLGELRSLHVNKNNLVTNDKVYFYTAIVNKVCSNTIISRFYVKDLSFNHYDRLTDRKICVPVFVCVKGGSYTCARTCTYTCLSVLLCGCDLIRCKCKRMRFVRVHFVFIPILIILLMTKFFLLLLLLITHHHCNCSSLLITSDKL